MKDLEKKLITQLHWALSIIEEAGMGDQNGTPAHNCEFFTNPEKGACDFHTNYWNAKMLLDPYMEQYYIEGDPEDGVGFFGGTWAKRLKDHYRYKEPPPPLPMTPEVARWEEELSDVLFFGKFKGRTWADLVLAREWEYLNWALANLEEPYLSDAAGEALMELVPPIPPSEDWDDDWPDGAWIGGPF